MTPKEKATELFKKYYCMNNDSKSKLKVIGFETAKQCALIAVDLVIDNIEDDYLENDLNYWEDVKQEIEKL
jgi:hypothetical protein